VSAAAQRLVALLRHPLLTNSTALVALRATNLLGRLALLFAIAHSTTPSVFGVVVFVLSLAEIGKVAADFGMDTLAIREFAGDAPPSGSSRFAAALAAGKVVFGVITYAALALWLAWTGPPERLPAGLVVATLVWTSLLIGFSLDWFQARLRVSRVLVPVSLLNAVLAVLAVLAVPHLPDLRLQVALLPLLELASGLALLQGLRREGLLASPLLEWSRVPALVAESLPLAVTGVLIMIYSRLDVLVLSSRLPAAEVGHYGVAFRLTEPVQIAAAAFGLSVFSRFSARFRDPSVRSLWGPAFKLVMGTLAYGAACAVALGLLAPPLLLRFFPDYLPAIPVLQVLAAGLVFRSMNATLAAVLLGAGRFRLLTGLAAWNLAAVFGMLTLLVGRFGAQGAAFALLAVEALNTLIQFGLVARELARHERSAARAS